MIPHRSSRSHGRFRFATIAELAEGDGIAPSYTTRVPRLTLLAPDIIVTTLDRTQGPEATLARVLGPFFGRVATALAAFDLTAGSCEQQIARTAACSLKACLAFRTGCAALT